MSYAKTLGLACALCLSVSSAVAAKPPLREVAYVDDGLFQIALANVIRKGCDDIDARLLRAFGVLRDLKSHALSLGYTEAEIDAYVDSDAEKDRMRARGAELFQARGVNPDNPEDLCRMGREEIASNSPVGKLLKAK
ncbi:DUF5333 domain-containing protein [Aestuariivita boseongensis]|uniref:DUF5333 domain-containing protein n=1 Tax=Aestuariivita boseongensis TaxID=1470562 RepID=UPI000680D2CD|nr:DUF5333 domain-containing protein [Aestuariivita boseongensis]